MTVWEQHLKPGDLFIDVGANVGSYTIWAIEMGARVIAVEPDAASIVALKQNLALNDYEAEVCEAALADKAGSGRLTAGLGVLNHLVADDSSDQARTVRTTTLDELIGDRVASGVKIDVEGAEGLVLEGARRALREQRIRLLQLEWNPQSDANFGERREDTATKLDSFGYELCRPDDRGVLRVIDYPGPGWDVFARPVMR